MKLRAQPINCTLKTDATKPSSTDAMLALLAKEFQGSDVDVAETIRIAAANQFDPDREKGQGVGRWHVQCFQNTGEVIRSSARAWPSRGA